MAIHIESLRQTCVDPMSLKRQPKTGATLVGSQKTAGKPSVSAFRIDVRFVGGLTQSQKNVFDAAASRWSQVITGDLPSYRLPTGEVVDDVLIDARGVSIDGPNGTLGRAGPVFLRTDSLLPAYGIMEFDTADLQRMETDGSLKDVIIHEMGHVLGIGTIWDDKGLLVGCPTANPVFLGEAAMREFATLTGGGITPVPVANTGGPGTRCGHWRESILGNELMTGFLNTGINPLSRMTIGSLEDLGYTVNYDAADPYELPSPLEMALMGIGGDGHRQYCRMCGGGDRPISPVVLPADSSME
ncbi:MAG: hypothetical protein MI923_18790 [Phycisphaerales bacterium]|nr:hypothetical protein [Phycisphaerales bacterium]